MKLNYKIFLLTLIVAVIFGSAQKVKAQSGDTLLVEWQDPNTGEVIVDALRNAIINDTNRPEGRVYKLQKGGFYWLSERIVNDGWHLRIIGETPGPTELENPAVIQMVARADGSHDGRIITGGGSITMKNVYVIGADETGVQTYYQPIQIDASNSRFVFDNCIFERTNFALVAFTAKNNDIFFTNCKFRNLIGQPSTQQWEGRGISIWADQDTVVVENCTFFNVGMTALQIEGGAANYVRFNHNTLVNVGRSINAGNWWIEAYFANLLLINGFWHGEGFADYDLGRNPNRQGRTAGMFSIGALPSKYGPEEGRRIVFAKAANWRDPAFIAYYGDTIRAQPFINEITANDFVNRYDAMVVQDTMWLDTRPNIKTYTPEIIQDMIQNIKDLRASKTPAQPYFWKLPDNPLVPSWPLPEDFSYTDANLLTAGTNGFPLGDLNWFPDKKAEWEAIKDKDIADIKALAGKEIKLTVVEIQEAEKGTVSGTAEVKSFSGFAYFQMDGGGFIQWDFNLPTAGQYDLNVWTHLRGNGTRGQRIIVNGVSIHDPMGWGEYIWSPSDQTANIWYGKIPNNEWTWTLIKQEEILEAGALTLPAGPNTIRIESSWGWQNFAGIDVIPAGTNTPVVQLRAADATYDLVQLKAENAVWTPNGLKYVAMGNNGTVTLNMTAPTDGKYRLQIFYQNPSTDQTAQIKVDGATVLSDVPLMAKTDSTGTNVLTANFDLTAGSHSFSIVASNVNLDFVQLIQEVSLSVKDLNQIPKGYALEQNYPNPFNPTTTINFSLAKPSNVKLTVYNILGQKVVTLVDKFMGAGVYSVEFNAKNLASGVYFYGIEAGDFKMYKKMILLK